MRTQDSACAEELEDARRLLEGQAREEHQVLVREGAGREWRDAGDTTLSGPSC